MRRQAALLQSFDNACHRGVTQVDAPRDVSHRGSTLPNNLSQNHQLR
jgi:hypothetical protein